MRFGQDLDGCIYQWDKTVRYMLRERIGGSAHPDLDGPSMYWEHTQELVEPSDWQWLWTQIDDMFRYGHLYKGAITYARELATLADIVVITHRPPAAVQATLDWLAYNRLPAGEVHIIDHKIRKSTIPCDVYVDDKPSNIEDVIEDTDAVAILMDRPWNNSYQLPSDPRAVRAASFEEVLEVVRSQGQW